MSDDLSAKPAAVTSLLTHQSDDRPRSAAPAAATGGTFLTVQAPLPGVFIQPENLPTRNGRNVSITCDIELAQDRLPPYLLKGDYREADPWRWRYMAQRYLATPAWADSSKMAEIYREADRRRSAGEEVLVDHLVPLNHQHVCGLHCEENLCIVTEKQNYTKSNYTWPDAWHECHPLELDEKPHQFQLEF